MPEDLVNEIARCHALGYASSHVHAVFQTEGIAGLDRLIAAATPGPGPAAGEAAQPPAEAVVE